MKWVIEEMKDWQSAAKQFLLKYPQGGIFGLSGDLGVGKTTFVRAVIKELAEREEEQAPRVLSPSFTILQSYVFQRASVDHFDFYRLENLNSSGLNEIGFWEACERVERDTSHYVLIEWPDKFQGQLPLMAKLQLKFSDSGRVMSVGS